MRKNDRFGCVSATGDEGFFAAYHCNLCHSGSISVSTINYAHFIIADPQVNRIEKAAYRDTLAQLREWNKAEQELRSLQAGRKSQQQRWREFLEIMEFGLRLRPFPSRHEQLAKVEMLENYHQRMRRIEQWRSRLAGPVSECSGQGCFISGKA